MSRRRLTPAVLTAIVLSGAALWPATAGAQQVTPPFQGLFTGAGGRVKPQSTWVSFSVETADDRNAAPNGSGADVSMPGRTYSDAVGEIHFDRNLHAFSVSASGSAALRADTAAGGNAALLKNLVTATLTSAPQRRTGFRFSATRIDAPYTLLTLDGPTSLESGDLVSATSDHFLTNRRVLIQGASASLSERLGRRTTVSADYDLRLSTGFEGLADLTTQRGSARIERQLTRSLAARGGYWYQFGSYSRPGDQRLNSREADAGLEVQAAGRPAAVRVRRGHCKRRRARTNGTARHGLRASRSHDRPGLERPLGIPPRYRRRRRIRTTAHRGFRHGQRERVPQQARRRDRIRWSLVHARRDDRRRRVSEPTRRRPGAGRAQQDVRPLRRIPSLRISVRSALAGSLVVVQQFRTPWRAVRCGLASAVVSVTRWRLHAAG